MTGPGENVLDVTDLTVTFETNHGRVAAVKGINFSLQAGRTLAVVGESGSGKSQSFLALAGLLADNGRASGQAMFEGRNLLDLPAGDLARMRGSRLAMIFQDPMTALNPYMTVGDQLAEVLVVHRAMSWTAARGEALRRMERVQMPDARRCMTQYPHEFSGGMRQRAMIAMAMMCDPTILIADEPTTALDVTIQAQILDLMQDLKSDHRSATVLIAHDMGVIAGLADEVMVMYAGRVIEYGPTKQILTDPRHPYTRGLLASIPAMAPQGRTLFATIPGQPPGISTRSTGCSFGPRCSLARDRCRMETPPLQWIDDKGGVACHLFGQGHP